MKAIIKIALENCVLCRGAHSAKESYEYAEKMEVAIRTAIRETLTTALKDKENLEENILQIIKNLES